MSRKTRLSPSAPLAVVAISLLLSACGRNADEYRRSRVLEERARAEAVAGYYQGLVMDAAGNAPLGHLAVDFEADTRVRQSPDGTRSEEVPVIRVRGVFTTTRAVTVVFEDASFDFETGLLKALLPVETRAGAKTSLSLTGTFADDRKSFAGRFGLDGYSDRAGRVQLSRDAVVESPLPQDDGSGRGLKPAFSFDQSYIGQAQLPALGTLPVGLELESVSEPGLPEIVDLFSPVRRMRASLRLTQDVLIEFDSADWDQSSGVLRATETLVVSETPVSVEVRLECQQKVASDARFAGTPAFICQFWSAWDSRRFRAVFEPSDASFEGGGLPTLGASLVGSLARSPTDRSAVPVILVVDRAAPGFRGDFSAIFGRSITARVTLALSPLSQIVFENSVWDVDARRLTARTQVFYLGKSSEARLECQGEQPRLPTVMTCQLRSGQRGDVRVFGVAPDRSGVELQPWLGLNARYAARDGERNVYMDLGSYVSSRDAELAEFFDGQRPVRAVLTFARDVTVTFGSAEWRLETGVLSAVNQALNGALPYELKLECREKTARGQPRGSQGWVCDYSSSLTGVYKSLDFSPVR